METMSCKLNEHLAVSRASVDFYPKTSAIIKSIHLHCNCSVVVDAVLENRFTDRILSERIFQAKTILVNHKILIVFYCLNKKAKKKQRNKTSLHY